MPNRAERRKQPPAPPEGQWSNAQRDAIIRALASHMLEMHEVINEDREALSAFADGLNEIKNRLEALENGKGLKPDDELLTKVMGCIAALPKGFHFNARNIADTLGENNGKVHAKIMVLVRHGKVLQHKENNRTSSFSVAPLDG